jgi:hypothetical protein
VQLYIYGFSKITAGRHEGGFGHPDFNRNDMASSCYLLKRNTCSDRRMKSRTSSIDSYYYDYHANSRRPVRSSRQPQVKKRLKQKKSNTTTQENGEIFLGSPRRHLVEKIVGEDPQQHQSPTTEYQHDHQGETFFEDNLCHPVQNENTPITLLFSSKPIMMTSCPKNSPAFLSDPTSIWHEDETCWDLEPRPIEDMIISSSYR